MKQISGTGNGRQPIRTREARAVSYSVEAMERRILFSAATWSEQELMEGTASHTLTPEQMQALDFVELQWQGKPIYAKAGE